MFGYKMNIADNGLCVVLRPATLDDLPHVVQGFSSFDVHRYTNGISAPTLDDERDWFERTRKDKETWSWVITAYHQNRNETDTPIGVTALHHVSAYHGSCNSGIVIWDKSWWGKGVASLAHLGRTLWAADELQRSTITSQVVTPNEASLKALLKVGYTVTGRYARNRFRDGRFCDTYCLSWLNPKVISLLFPDGLPKQYQCGVEKAETALEKARKIVTFV